MDLGFVCTTMLLTGASKGIGYATRAVDNMPVDVTKAAHLNDVARNMQRLRRLLG
jgi:short-subunit dehydrogenase